MPNKVLVTPRSVTAEGNHPALKKLTDAGYQIVFGPAGQQPTEDQLRELLPGCVGYLAGVEKIDATILAAATDLQVISRNGTGVDNVDLEAAQRFGIRVYRAQGANARGVAELTIALMFDLARSIPSSDRTIRLGGWHRRKGLELDGKTLGIVGFGKIGRIVAELAIGLGMKVYAHDPFPSEPLATPTENLRFASLEELLAAADFLTLHCPMPEDGTPVLSAERLGQLKPGVFLVNTARAGLVDTEALLAAIATGRLAGAAFDVFDTEPPQDRRLMENDRIIGTPHIGGYTVESVDRAMESAVDNLLDHLKQLENVG